MNESINNIPVIKSCRCKDKKTPIGKEKKGELLEKISRLQGREK